jgi:acetyltransferase-like isoleucine patch superfamily enzyme
MRGVEDLADLGRAQHGLRGGRCRLRYLDRLTLVHVPDDRPRAASAQACDLGGVATIRERLRVLRVRRRARGRADVGAGVRLGRGVRIAAARGARVLLEDGCRLGDGTRIDALGGVVRIGAGAQLGERVVIVARAGVEIGERAIVGDWAAIADEAPGFADPERPVRLQPLHSAPIAVAAGARVGPHAVIGPGARVETDVSPYEVVDAAPASSP